MGLKLAEEKQIFEPTHIGQIWGATWHPVIGPHVTSELARTIQSSYSQHPVNAHSTCTQLPATVTTCHTTSHPYCVTSQSTSIQPSHPATSTFVHPSHPATSASVQPPIIHTSMFHPVIGPHHVWTSRCHVRTLPRVNFVLVQLSLKMPKLSDTCHLLVLPHVLLTSS
jgi:hypothetical protein